MYEVRKPFNRYLGVWIELVDIVNTPHPADCACIDCKPRPARIRVEREYDTLDTKQDRLFWK